MPWYNAFCEPDDAGFIDADSSWPGSGGAVGHGVEALGVEIDSDDAFNSVLIYANSWDAGWGRWRLLPHALAHLRQLSGVDLKQFLI